MTDLIHDPAVCLTGKKDPKPSKLKIADYLDVQRILHAKAAANAIGAAWSLIDGISVAFQMYLNDQFGCCTLSGAGNLQIAQSQGSVRITDQDVETGYEAVTSVEGAGFNPGPPPVNDNGCVEVDVLDYWASVGIGGIKILGHAGVDMTNEAEWSAAAETFGGLYLGLALATEQQSQTIWDYVKGSQPGSWGGHCVPEVGFNVGPTGLIEVVTWGQRKQATLSFIKNQADEGHVVITPAWLAANANNPMLDLAKLTADLASYSPES